MVEAEWKNRVDMAPFAEALGITTDSVMTVMSPDRGQSWAVLFTETPTTDPDEWIWLGVLMPDGWGVLHEVKRSKHKTLAEFNEGLAEHMAEAMRKFEEGRSDG